MLIFPLFLLVPEQVTGLGFTIDNTNNVLTLTITWDSPSSELPITHYFVRIDETQRQRKVVGVTTLTITGTLGSTYTFSIIAVSAVGSGAWSESVTTQRKYIQKSFFHLTVHICRQCTVMIISTTLQCHMLLVHHVLVVCLYLQTTPIVQKYSIITNERVA